MGAGGGGMGWETEAKDEGVLQPPASGIWMPTIWLPTAVGVPAAVGQLPTTAGSVVTAISQSPTWTSTDHQCPSVGRRLP